MAVGWTCVRSATIVHMGISKSHLDFLVRGLQGTPKIILDTLLALSCLDTLNMNKRFGRMELELPEYELSLY